MLGQKFFVAWTRVVLMGLSFCTTTINAADTSPVLAEVNGTKITQGMLERYQRQRGMPKDADPAQQIEAMLNELINRELIYQDALVKGLDKAEDVKVEIEAQRINIIASAMLKRTADSNQISDDKLRSAYDRHVKELGNREYHARHILRNSEDEAKAVIKELKAGKDFTQLATAKSVGENNDDGGDLGWINPQQMIKPISDAVLSLKKGEFTQLPVKTEFGWHVIRLEDSRELPPPSFDSLKEQLRMRLQNKGVESYIASLREKAKVERKK